MTDCGNADVRDQLPDLVNGSLEPVARRAAEAHVRSCPDCSAEVELIRAARAVLGRGPKVDVAAITRAVASARHSAPRASPWRGARWTRAAAAAFLVVGAASAAMVAGGVLETGLRRGPDASGRSGATISVAQDQPANVGGGTTPLAAAGAGPEVALAAGVQFLSDAELESLLGEIDDLDGLPAEEPPPLLPALLDEGGAL
jgi:anti-sigma factor RsiW